MVQRHGTNPAMLDHAPTVIRGWRARWIVSHTARPPGVLLGGVADLGWTPTSLGRAVPLCPSRAVELGTGPAELEACLGALSRARIGRSGEPPPDLNLAGGLWVTRPPYPARAGGAGPRGGRRPAEAEPERADGDSGRAAHHPAPRGTGPERLHETIKVFAV